MRKETEIRIVRDLLDLREVTERERRSGNPEPMLTLTINTLDAVFRMIKEVSESRRVLMP